VTKEQYKLRETSNGEKEERISVQRWWDESFFNSRKKREGREGGIDGRQSQFREKRDGAPILILYIAEKKEERGREKKAELLLLLQTDP